MGIDRFVRWKKSEHAPSVDNIKTVLEDYLGEALYRIEVDGPRITVLIEGKPRFPFRRIHGAEYLAPVSEQHNERWFEVFVEERQIDVITRQTDEYTNVVAEGFAALVARFWKGKREEQ